MRERQVYGSTGEVGADGILTPEQAAKLDHLQRDTAREAFVQLDAHQPGDLFPMAAMATGIGKGRIIHLVIEKQMRRKPDSRIVVIAGTKKILIHQTQNALNGYQQESDVSAEEEDELNESEIGENPLKGQSSKLYKVGRMGQRGTNVKIETAQRLVSMMQRGELFTRSYDLLIPDEVHNLGTPLRKEVAQRFRKALGFTATAHRHSGVLKHPEEYGFKIFKDYPLPQAQEDGLLPPLLGVQIDTKGLVDAVPTTRGGKINYPALEKMLKASPQLQPFIADKLAEIIRPDPQTQYKTVVAVNFVWEAQKIAKHLRKQGITAGLLINQQAARQLHTEEIPTTDSLQRYFLPQDHPDAVQVLLSPYVAGEGFDAPFTEVLAWASPTDSGLRYGQYNGRLARRANGKAYGMVVDFLYQTDQYQWSQNMSRWMKGNVQQLDSGLLYVGAKRDIQSVTQQPGVRRLGENLFDRASAPSLEELTTEIESLQPGDLSLTAYSLRNAFKGNRYVLDRYVRVFKEQYSSDHPEYFAVRIISGIGPADVITQSGREALIQHMEKRGIMQSDKARIEEIEQAEGEDAIQLTDFSLTIKDLTQTFIGNPVKIIAARNEVLEEMRVTDPDSIATRKTKRNVSITVLTNFNAYITFMSKMQTQGLVVRPDSDEE